MQFNPILSIIIPCFNNEHTISRTLDSILTQKTDFPYEIIIINDASTDDTNIVLNNYMVNHQNILIINHNHNMGNAQSFYDGLSHAKGDFFCVLDADDYYTDSNKLQYQFNFFNDDILYEYVGITHYFIFDFGDGNIIINDCSSVTDFTYIDFISQNTDYFHTSTYMFRNIFKGNVPEYFKEDIFRGDTARTALILKTSNKKIKILDFFGSAYVYNFNGIWSSMSIKEQNIRENIVLEAIKNITNTNYEKQCIDNWINNNNISNITSNKYQSFYTLTIEESINKIKNDLVNLYINQKNYIDTNMYYSNYIDSLCTTLGYINTIYNPNCLQNKVISNHIAIVINTLDINNTYNINFLIELIEVYSNNEILVLLTDISEENISLNLLEVFNKYPKVIIKAIPINIKDKLYWLSLSISEFAPYLSYYFSSLTEPYSLSLIRHGLCKNILILFNNQGLMLGITNSNIDLIITRFLIDFSIINKYYEKKIIYIPQSDTIKSYISNENPYPLSILSKSDNSALAKIYLFEKNINTKDFLKFNGNKLIINNKFNKSNKNNIFNKIQKFPMYLRKIKYKTSSIGIRKTIKLILIKSIFR